MRGIMKRSRSIALLAMGVSALALTACGEDETPVGVYTSVDQCIADKQYTEQECRASFETAKREHTRVAPRYATVADCEADFGPGKCERATATTTTTTTTTSFWPIFAGYMLGRAIGGAAAPAAQPLYRTQGDGRFRTGDNRVVTNKTGFQPVPASTTSAPSTKTGTISRGGFGSSGRVYGSTGSSGRTGSSSGG
jgi:uncharacterized protein YgiB involved in biofilm formation